jgi:3-hydroxymyristoyl/3-hydroxydecanoyl-(acyl carrier protein) dehydratase
VPIVPGVVQLQWVIEAAGRVDPTLGHVERVEALKFQTLLRPGDDFTLRVERVAESTFGFRLESGTQTYSSGRLRFAGEAPS